MSTLIPWSAAEPLLRCSVNGRMNELQLTEKHIVSAYERIQRQRQLIAHLRKHRRTAPLIEPAMELLGLMQSVCKEYRVHRKFIQRLKSH